MNARQQDMGGSGKARPPIPGAFLLSLLVAGNAFAQTSTGLPAIEALPSPALGLELATELTWQAPATAPPRESPRVSPARAFNMELREEAIDYRFTNPWAYADEELRGDRPVREGRSRAAENMLGDAATAGLEVILRDALNKPKRQRETSSSTPSRGLRHQIRIDTSPTWRLRTRAGLTHVRIDLPLSAHDHFSLRCTRRVDRNTFERQIGASVRLNPWDESISFGFDLDF